MGEASYVMDQPHLASPIHFGGILLVLVYHFNMFSRSSPKKRKHVLFETGRVAFAKKRPLPGNRDTVDRVWEKHKHIAFF